MISSMTLTTTAPGGLGLEAGGPKSFPAGACPRRSHTLRQTRAAMMDGHQLLMTLGKRKRIIE